MFDLKELLHKLANRVPLTTEEYIFVVQNSDKALWGFMISNNPGNINNTLRHKLGYSELGFNPNPTAIAAQIDMMIKKGEADEIDLVIKNFRLNTDGLDASFINEFNQLFIQ
jgi:hypothetical protein